MGTTQELSKLVDEQVERVFHLYDAKAKSFIKIFGGLMIFALLFFFVVLYPYVSMKVENHKVVQRKVELTQASDAAEKKIKAYTEANDAISELHRRIDDFPVALRKHIQQLQQQQNEQQQGGVHRPPQQAYQANAPPQPQPCTGLSGDDWWRCMMKKEVLGLFDEYDENLRTKVLAPLQSASVRDPFVVNLGAFATGLDSLRGRFNALLEANPTFWETYQGKTGFSIKVHNDMNLFWQQYGAGIDSQRVLLDQQMSQLNKEKTRLAEEETWLSQQQQKLIQRLSQIEFPIGSVPLGLSEAVAVFPVLLVGMFVFSISQLCSSIRLRNSFHQLSLQRDPGQKVLSQHQMIVAAPLWIDPLSSTADRRLRVAILAVPCILFIIACVMIIYSWSVPDSFLVLGQFPHWLLLVLYAFSFGALFFSYRQLYQEVRDYTIGK